MYQIALKRTPLFALNTKATPDAYASADRRGNLSPITCKCSLACENQAVRARSTRERPKAI